MLRIRKGKDEADVAAVVGSSVVSANGATQKQDVL